MIGSLSDTDSEPRAIGAGEEEGPGGQKSEVEEEGGREPGSQSRSQ